MDLLLLCRVHWGSDVACHQGAKKFDVFCLSIMLLNSKVYECEIAIKLFELRRDFYTIR